jgi:enoyl-CoA hydratase
MSSLRVENRSRLAVLRLDKARGNAIDEPLVEELIRVGRELERDDAVRGVLLASAHPKLFCPGFDLQSLIDYDRPAMERFLPKFAEALWTLFGLRKPLLAAVAGHAVAGGCILALTADQRLLRSGGVEIGLADVKVGVPLPWTVTVLLRATLPPGALASIALLGRNFADREALDTGLAHELLDGEGFEAACLARLEEFSEKDALALSTTKSYLRTDALREMKAHEHERAHEFLDAWFSEATRERMRQTVVALRSKGT